MRRPLSPPTRIFLLQEIEKHDSAAFAFLQCLAVAIKERRRGGRPLEPRPFSPPLASLSLHERNNPSSYERPPFSHQKHLLCTERVQQRPFKEGANTKAHPNHFSPPPLNSAEEKEWSCSPPPRTTHTHTHTRTYVGWGRKDLLLLRTSASSRVVRRSSYINLWPPSFGMGKKSPWKHSPPRRTSCSSAWGWVFRRLRSRLPRRRRSSEGNAWRKGRGNVCGEDKSEDQCDILKQKVPAPVSSPVAVVLLVGARQEEAGAVVLAAYSSLGMMLLVLLVMVVEATVAAEPVVG